MELAIKDLNLGAATSIMPYPGGDEGDDPYQMIQVHDYQNVRFLRMDPTIRATTRRTIDVFSMAYPELLREKFFVNVPAIMGWMFGAMKMFLSKNTTRKFHPITNGMNLAREFPGEIGELLPTAYGGEGPDLKDGARTVTLVDEDEAGSGGAKEGHQHAHSEPAKEPAWEEPTKAEPTVTTDPATAVEAK